MNMRTTHILAKRGLHQSRLIQIFLLALVWAVAQLAVQLTGLPVPSAILGMAAVLIALGFGWISVFSLRRGANWFLAEMLLFFVPAVVAVLNHRELIGLLGLKIMLVIAIGTLSVMTVTALTVDLCYRWKMRHDTRSHSAA